MSAEFVTTGDMVSSEAGTLMGHGTILIDGNLHATVSGFVQRVNKLVSVIPFNSRYGGEVGDVVVGRVLEVSDKKWKIDINGRQLSILALSSLYLPGGEQRRRTNEDSLKMRDFFQENDLISAEVQKVRHDGSISLHTRNLKYGKLIHGVLVRVPSSLIRRCKHHFQEIVDGINCILGNNGFIWIYDSTNNIHKPADSSNNNNNNNNNSDTKIDLDDENSSQSSNNSLASRRMCMARVRNSILILSSSWQQIWCLSIANIYNTSLKLSITPSQMRNPDIIDAIVQAAAASLNNSNVAVNDADVLID